MIAFKILTIRNTSMRSMECIGGTWEWLAIRGIKIRLCHIN